MLATHVLGPHLLTRLLRPAMPRGARVIWVASGGMYGQRLRADDLEYEQGEYKPTTGYARTKRAQVVRKPADGSRDAQPIVVVESRAYLRAVTPDETTALLDSAAPTTSGRREDLMTVALVENAKPQPLLKTDFGKYGSAWSRDRRYLAYVSDESGRDEVYVRDMSSNGGRWQVSTDGGEEPSWSPNGRELYYRNESRLMVVAIDTRLDFAPKTPAVLLGNVYNLRSDTGISYDVAPKGDRFLMVRPTEENAASTITVVMNWFAELKRLTASAPR